MESDRQAFPVVKPPEPPEPESTPGPDWPRLLAWVAAITCYVLALGTLWGHFLLYHLLLEPALMQGGDMLCVLSAILSGVGFFAAGCVLIGVATDCSQ